ncbi:MAG: hypothetical protein IT334_08335 [Thermomicrobiales bacterium]|nr:hypothetical protein [Thermomicrobiales bacterium]
MFLPYTAIDLVRVIEEELTGRHRAAESSRQRLLPDTQMRLPVTSATRTRFSRLLSRITSSTPA